MPKLGSTKRRDRDCLVCGTTTRVAHMGIDVCRACTVFYRRAEEHKAKPYVCRSGTSRCTAGKGLNCKKCRLRLLKHFLKESCAIDEAIPAPVPPHEEPVERDETHPDSSSLTSVAIEHHTGPIPLLNRVKAAYEKLCFGRLMGELYSRKNPPPPSQICSTNYPIFPATFVTMNHANRVLISCIMDFGKSAYPEFGLLSNEEQWSITVKFFYTFRKLDNSYRAHKRFSDFPSRVFAGYTLYLSEEVIEHYFDDYDEEKGDVEEARKIMMNMCTSRPKVGRNVIKTMRPDDHEFLAMATLLFWAANGVVVSDEFARISENYRQQISSELHIYYRDILHLDDYASRLGTLYTFLPMLENNEKVKETFEVLRLLDIFTDDSFTYKLNKA